MMTLASGPWLIALRLLAGAQTVFASRLSHPAAPATGYEVRRIIRRPPPLIRDDASGCGLIQNAGNDWMAGDDGDGYFSG